MKQHVINPKPGRTFKHSTRIQLPLFDKALNEMTNEFTSDQFADAAREAGIDDYDLKCGIGADYLHSRVWQKCKYSQTWYKQNPIQKEIKAGLDLPKIEPLVSIKISDVKDIDKSVIDAIELLKGLGYLVKKPQTVIHYIDC